MQKIASKVTRRSLLAGMAGVLAAPTVMGPSRAAAKSESLTLISYGGSYQDILVKYALTPFTEETGIQVNVVPAPDLAKIKAQLLMGNVEWDIYDTTDSQAAFGSKQGFWEKLDPSMFDVGDMVVPPQSDFVSWSVVAIGIGWDPKRYGPGKHPANFADFFDLKNFQGRRALRAYAEGNLEAALLADGVSPKDMYPLDVERALNVLDHIKPSVAAWSAAPQQPITLLQTGEVDFSFTTVNRVKATTEPGGGVPLAFSFEQNVFYTDSLAVLKGAPNKENAMKLVAYLLRPEVQARVTEPFGFIPVSKNAKSMFSDESSKWLPDLNNPKSLFTSNIYWADNFESVSRRFKEWIVR
ncbi:ABC transporter substrate-binding protein [Bradyrhizobium sp. 169]|uniref:ABC transporter substrate-binding protein n=1 Tax=Bradyrhizobium sp. 169 TaxID=2782640 RepID=UPI001FFB8629|nr:ABC transporter substrate-binding protein [Bradyrhizobium sp. 169]MCK1592108.1 ABC transporter substrate-binding protein [Bradyrhizobium sp. 169]